MKNLPTATTNSFFGLLEFCLKNMIACSNGKAGKAGFKEILSFSIFNNLKSYSFKTNF
jgi:hypothetical protein